MMKTVTLLALSLMLLSGCAGTRRGVTEDADSFGTKVQRTGEIWTSQE